MTPAQRKQHIKDINSLLTEVWGNCDTWGHYKCGDYRIKMQKTSLRLENKPQGFGRWVRCSSSYFKNVEIDEFRKQLDGIKIGRIGNNGIIY